MKTEATRVLELIALLARVQALAGDKVTLSSQEQTAWMPGDLTKQIYRASAGGETADGQDYPEALQSLIAGLREAATRRIANLTETLKMFEVAGSDCALLLLWSMVIDSFEAEISFCQKHVGPFAKAYEFHASEPGGMGLYGTDQNFLRARAFLTDQVVARARKDLASLTAALDADSQGKPR